MTVIAGPEPAQADLLVAQGATFRVEFRWIENSVPQSLDGMSAVLTIARRQGAAPAVQVTSDAGEIVLEPLDDNDVPRTGVLQVEISPVKTGSITFRSGRYDLLVSTDDGDIVRLYEGRVVVDRAVTPVVTA